ncbi:MAG: 23S rRNA (pseudouridine(1915)-N(3))-methyltransferase RlmH [Deltaproteobacteria bacterium]|nr:23S rRNA (pseudouridine(1915)-N(3))-methyltransferase RlmH [Deltaproteobacteria bacterium]
MRLVLAPVGRVKEAPLRALLDDYYTRIQRYTTLREVELREGRPAEVLAAGRRVLDAEGPRALPVALEVQGEALTSEGLARRLGGHLDAGGVPVFFLGGAEGLPAELSREARWRLSLGPLTLPHRLARLVLAEQVYRAFTILRGEPYHK